MAADVDRFRRSRRGLRRNESVETFSSDGPRRILYEADGTPSPLATSRPRGDAPTEPDLTAADCVSTATPDFGVFCGTSAAAPHAAAIAALLLELGSATGVTATQIRDALANTALDIEAAGVDRDSGSGIVDAVEAADALDRTECEDEDRQRRRRRHRLPRRPWLRLRQRSVGAVGGSPLRRRPRQRQRRKNRFRSGDLRQPWQRDQPPSGPGDPGCKEPLGRSENPQCQDGFNNDGMRKWTTTRSLQLRNGAAPHRPVRIRSASTGRGETTRDNRRPAAWGSSWYFSCRR